MLAEYHTRSRGLKFLEGASRWLMFLLFAGVNVSSRWGGGGGELSKLDQLTYWQRGLWVGGRNP